MVLSESVVFIRDKIMDAPNCWNTCPVEIIIIIFKLLDPKTLSNCMHISRKWRDIAVSVVSTKRLWKVLVEENMLDSGKSYKRKSKLNWCGIYMNSIQWHDVENAEIELANNLDIVVKSFSIYKDNLILVSTEKVIYFNIETFERVKEFPCICKKYEESDDIIVTTPVNLDFVIMNGKHHETDGESVQRTSAIQQNVMFYRLEGNEVYIMVKDQNTLYIYTWTKFKWDIAACARYYGCAGIISSLVYDKEMYILTKGGRTYRTNEMIFCFENYESSNYSLPSSMTVKDFGLLDEDKLFIVGDTTRTNNHCSYDNVSNTIYLECPDLTCITQHEDVLFLGYNSGKVEIGIPSNMLKNNGKPELSFYVKPKRRISDFDVLFRGLILSYSALN
ncbi:hypothetical protein K1T71_004643 [Dendrolimus kikuchii]|uniref:Uncharacterized protein n=1 Tax=Dendrolimus kikuchii TaxID=765133 RepID=A0ACC1D9G3_9NEOP|nr:hypothetical protein K1T71_004643 [Dendrolimus kikuchii]